MHTLEELKMESLEEFVETGMKFHGHKCPAMPLGIRAGLAARRILGVNRAPDKELHVVSETGKGHAMGCFLDGVMTATGCTYGKSNIEKTYFNKMAFTLIDKIHGRSVRVSLKPDFVQQALGSPFVQKRKEGVPPQDIPTEVVDPLVERILSLPEEEFLDIGDVKDVAVEKKKGLFETERCSRCGEVVFVDKLRVLPDGDHVCIPCSGYSG